MISYHYILYLLLAVGAVGTVGTGFLTEHPETDPTGIATTVGPDTPPLFSKGINQGLVKNPDIKEASGMAASRNNPGLLWTHNDSGGKPRLFLLGPSGKKVFAFLLKGARNRDWEDMAIGPGPEEGIPYLYIGEIGDNNSRYGEYRIYRVKEPKYDSLHLPSSRKLEDYDTITYRYPDGPRDAETLMVDPYTKDLYVISKRESQVGVYRAKYPQAMDSVLTLQKMGTLPFQYVVAGDISASGDEVLIKTYQEVHYWRREEGESLMETLSRRSLSLPYDPEPQGESVAWGVDGKGYYTLSEQLGPFVPSLFFYKRL